MMSSECILVIFAQYRTILDQLPQAGFYVAFLKDGYSLMMPLKAVDTLEEARNVPDRPDHVKVVLDGKKPFRLWYVNAETETIQLVSEHATRDEMTLKASNLPCKMQQSGPSVPRSMVPLIEM